MKRRTLRQRPKNCESVGPLACPDTRKPFCSSMWNKFCTNDAKNCSATNLGKSKRGLSKRGLGPKSANWGKKGPFGALSALPLSPRFSLNLGFKPAFVSPVYPVLPCLGCSVLPRKTLQTDQTFSVPAERKKKPEKTRGNTHFSKEITN